MRNKLNNIINYYLQETKHPGPMEVRLRSQDFDDFAREMEFSKQVMELSHDPFLSQSGDKGFPSIIYNYAGVQMSIYRAIYRKDFSVLELGGDDDMYSRSFVLYDKGAQGKDIILL